MNYPKTGLRGLLVSTALTGALATLAFAPAALAQAPAAAGDQNANVLSDIVVTATRQADTVSRVPLSISAVTQKALDQQGIQTVGDLTRIVPSLTTSTTGGVSQFTIRGVTAGGSGAATTGVYLDDTPLTKRNQNGAASNNGTPAPPLFDIERVEVLRGPQGTLYGGSSEGGTVRFITPTPSLTTYSVYAKAQVSTTHDGAGSWLAGAAVGGPIVQDKLGFRVSAYNNFQGGWIDDVNPYNGTTVYKQDSNYERTHAIRAVLLWRPTENLSIEPAIYTSRDYTNDLNIETLPTTLNNVQTAAALVAKGWTLPTNWGNTVDYCINYNGVPANGSGKAPVSCAGPHTHLYPAHIYGPYNLQPYQYLSPAGPYENNPFTAITSVYSLTLGYDFDKMHLTAVSSYLGDEEKTISYGGSVVTQNFGGYPSIIPPDPNFQAIGTFHSGTKRYGITDEARLAYDPAARPLTFVLGVYYSNVRGAGSYENFVQGDRIYGDLFGLNTLQRTGVPELVGGSFAHRDQTLVDKETAAYGEANYYITDRLKLIVGARVSRVTFSYREAFFGPLNGFDVPTVENGGLTAGTVTQTPITPKGGIQYQFTDNDQVYVTAAKGYRAGGVNSPLPPLICGAALTQLGLTVQDIPTVYGSDSIWSFEAGSKLRLLNNRLQLNGDVFDIDWSNLQQTISLGFSCGPTFVTNVGKATSKGFELEGQALLFPGFTADFSMGYTDAYVAQDTFGPKPLSGATPTIVALKGQPMGVPNWTFHVGGVYNFQVAAHDMYIRGDYTLIPAYNTSNSMVGTPTYTPDLARSNRFEELNARVGVVVNGWDLNVYANNILNDLYGGGSTSGGRTGCTVASGAACTAFGNYNALFTVNTIRPREFGVQAVYRFH